MNNGPLRLEAAVVLEPHLRAQSSHTELLVALGARTEFDTNAESRLAAAMEALSLFVQGPYPPKARPGSARMGSRQRLILRKIRYLIG